MTKPAEKTYDYIKRASFEMPDFAQPTSGSEVTYVPVQFWVPDTPMDAAVGDTLDARIKFIWSTAEKAEDQEHLEQHDNEKVHTSALDYTDKDTGVKIHGDADVFPEGTTVKITKANVDTADGEKAVGYEVKLFDADRNEIAPNGVYSLSLPVPNGYDSPKAYRIKDGKRTLVSGENKDGAYTVLAKEAGIFALVQAAAGTNSKSDSTGTGTKAGTNGSTTDNPNTGAAAGFGGLAIAAAGMLLAKKRKEK